MHVAAARGLVMALAKMLLTMISIPVVAASSVVSNYQTTGASYSLPAGAHAYGDAMFFMKEEAVEALGTADGFKVGVDRSALVVDEGMPKSRTTINMQDDIYPYIFGRKGLMAGLGLQGNKIDKINK